MIGEPSPERTRRSCRDQVEREGEGETIDAQDHRALSKP